MSFRGDEQRRYGHVPPVQYPVAGQQQQYIPSQPQQPQYDQTQYPARRPSFNNGDDTSYFDQGRPQLAASHQLHHAQPSIPSRGEDELFLTSPVDGPVPAPPLPAKPAAYANPAAGMAGYQHQYQTQASPSSYNPLAFARSQSQSLPYHPAPSTRLASPTVPSFSTFQSQSQPPPPQQQQQQQQPSQNYTPAAYNPAAYASTQGAGPQRTSTYAGYSSYQQQHSYSTPTVPHAPVTASSPYTQQTANPALYTPPVPVQLSPTPSTQSSYQPGSYYNSTASAATASPQPNSYDQSQHNYSTSNSNFTPANNTLNFPANGVSPMPSPGAIPSTMTSQAPYPSYSQMPVSGAYTPGADANTFATRVSRSSSSASPGLPSPPVHSSSPAGIQRHPTNAPLPIRPPMEDLQEEPGWSNGSGGIPHGGHNQRTQDSLIHDIEADLGISGVGTAGGENGSLRIPATPGIGNYSDDDFYRQPSRASSTHPSTAGWSSAASGIDRASSSASTASSNAYQVNAPPTAPSTYRWEDDSDPEGAFGVYEMQQADLDEQRFSISGASMGSGVSSATTSHYDYGHPQVMPQQPQHQQQHDPAAGTRATTPLPRQPEGQHVSDPEFVGMDLGLFSGGYAGSLAYGNEGVSHVGRSSSTSAAPVERPPQSTTPRPYEVDSQYAPFLDAEMDYGGTGGLQPPALHRLSFDEGDEHVSVHSGLSGSESPSKEEYPDMFYHPGLSSRPLPALPPGPAEAHVGISGSNNNNLLSATPSNASRLSYQQHSYSHSSGSRSSTYLSMQEQQQQLMLQHQQYQHQLQVERSTSMSSHSTTPAVQVPGRSRTDAAEERRKVQRQVAAQQGVPYDNTYDASNTAASLAYDVITLPSGRRKKFVPAKLVPNDFRRCQEPWALSSIARWVREMADGEPDLKRKTIEEGLVALFTAKAPNMNVADAETLAANVADSMFAAGILIPEEEWVKFGPGEISGVLWQMSGSGCYAPFVHVHETHGRCYSYYCTRTLKKANLDEIMSEESVKKEDWVTFYKITKEVMEGKPRKEVERQNVLHEIVTSEEEFNNQLDVLRVLYKNQLRHWEPPIIPPNRLDKFINIVFGKVESMQRVNKDHLLAQLKYRQNEQGPWIMGFSDIFREWIRKAKDEYIAYSTDYPVASFTVRKEAARNVLFRQFLEHVRNHRRSDRLGWDTFLKAPITRLQRYSLLLSTVLKNTVQDSEEKVNLARAIDEIRLVTKDCDRLVDEMAKKVSLQELQNQLVFRPGFQTVLNLDHLGRELLMQGDLQRMGSKGVRWVDTHALLFDHYFILAKAVSSKEGRNDKKYDVSKEPIPMPLLLLESMNDDPVSKQKGLAAPLARTTAASAPDIRLNKVISNGSARPELEHTATSSSTNSVSRLNPGTPGEEGKTLYPFRVKHLGHEVYTLYATTPQSRQDWCNKIVEAKTRHARALLEQNAEPFRLRIMADSAFAYDSLTAVGKQPGVSIRGTPLDRSIREMEQVFGPGRGPTPVCRATVNCATGFTAYGKAVTAIGTDFGLYISDVTNPRGWTRSVQINKVTQIAVLEEFSVCLVLADRALISYPLDVVAPVSNFPVPTHDSARRAPQRLAKDVSFFATARMKERTLLFYKRKEGMHNTFKVLEPVFQKASEKKSRFFGSRRGHGSSGGAGNTESFRDFDEFYLPTECYSLNLFQSYVAVSTAKGIEMLTLDRKQTMSVPRDLAMPATANIAARIRDQRPLGMFRLNDQEFLLAYEDCAVYADKHGEVSRTLIMEYSGKQKKARAATMFGQYLLLFNEDYVEVRNAENGRLRQIIAGNDVRCLDYGFRGPTGGDNASATAAVPAPNNTSNVPSSPTTPSGQDSKGTVKICMTHPEAGGMQIVLELLLNDGHSEKI